jgi:hypothetical protein
MKGKMFVAIWPPANIHRLYKKTYIYYIIQIRTIKAQWPYHYNGTSLINSHNLYFSK